MLRRLFILKAKDGNRFENAREFMKETLANAIAVGDSSLPFFGPHFFCGFTFFEEKEEGTHFDPATVFVPKWQVTMASGKCVATANAFIDAGAISLQLKSVYGMPIRNLTRSTIAQLTRLRKRAIGQNGMWKALREKRARAISSKLWKRR